MKPYKDNLQLLSIFNRKKLYLASQSPRRRELLQNFGVEFELLQNNVEEELHDGIENPADFVMSLVHKKSEGASSKVSDGLILTADTIVHIEGEILEKPVDKKDAARMIETLQGRTHQVYTGLCVFSMPEERCCNAVEVSDVTFAPMDSSEIDWYIESADYMDKAGAYAIQEHASLFISKIDGCYFNVVGLPIYRLYTLFLELDHMLK